MKERGFTYLETCVLLGVLGVILSLALPESARSSREFRLDSQAEAIASEMSTARYQAVAENQRCRVRFNTAQGTYQTEREVGGQWVVSRSPRGVGTGVYILNAPDAVFGASGQAEQAVNIVLQNSDGTSRTVTVTLGGRVKIV